MSQPTPPSGGNGTPAPNRDAAASAQEGFGGLSQSPGQPPSSWGAPNSAWNQTTGWAAPGGDRPASSPPEPGSVPTGPTAPVTGPTPFQETSRPRVSIDQYRTKRNVAVPILLLAAVLVVVAGVLYFGTRPEPVDSASATPTPSRTTLPTPATPGGAANEIRFETDQVSGTFILNSSQWEGSTLTVDVTVSVDTGSLEFWFVTMDVATGDVYDVSSPTQSGDIRQETLRAGGSASGTLHVTKPRGDTQLLLSDVNGDNLTMLLISG